MSMFTACPNCKLHLAVTAADLRVGQGYVRCGRCDRVFNALLSLGEDPDRETDNGLAATGTATLPALEHTDDAILTGTPPAPEPGSTDLPDAGVEAGFDPQAFLQDAAPQQGGQEQAVYIELADPDLPLEAFSHADSAGPDHADHAELAEHEAQAEPEPEDFVAPDEWSKVSAVRPKLSEEVEVEETMATGTFETIVLEGDTILQTEEHVDETEVDAQLKQIADQMVSEKRNDAIEPSEPIEPVETDTAVGGVDVGEQPAEDVVMESAPEADIDADAVVGNAPRLHWGWSAAAAALLLALGAQVVNHHRQALVAKAWAEQPLRVIYGLFGVRLEPRWDLKAYDLRQLGGEALPGDAAKIVLRATVQNRATSSQPPPMIRVTLQDRFGNALSTTAIAPQDYLKGSAPSRIDADQRLDALLQLDDPNRQAVGFELDACLPDGAGRLHCSTDP